MDQMRPKAKKWIDENKDPRSARWHAGLEAVMELFLPALKQGRLTPVCPLGDNDLAVFNAALEKVDLSPWLLGAFLPPSVADPIVPPDSIEELVRIEKGKPSYKIIIQRPGDEDRLFCAEISEQAHRPGVDIFQSGQFLGNFDYSTSDICIMELTKAIRAHVWGKEKWQRRDYLDYTLNWFEKVAYLNTADVGVDERYSFFHSPTVIKMNRVDALFLLLYEVLRHRYKEDPEILKRAVAATGVKPENKKIKFSICESIAEAHMLDLLNQIKNLELLDFAGFTNAENHSFQNEFVRILRRLTADMEKMAF